MRDPMTNLPPVQELSDARDQSDFHATVERAKRLYALIIKAVNAVPDADSERRVTDYILGAFAGEQNIGFVEGQSELQHRREAEAGTPEGWVLVPREPTKAMIEAGLKKNATNPHPWCPAVYRAMIKAAPAASDAHPLAKHMPSAEALRARIEADPDEGEIGVGFELGDMAALERLAMEVLPAWARDELIDLRARVSASPSPPASGVKAWSEGFVALQHWRDEDNEDAITLTRNDIISLIEDYRSALGEHP